MFGSVIGCDTNQKAPFITKRGRFELTRKDLHKRRLSFTVFGSRKLLTTVNIADVLEFATKSSYSYFLTSKQQ